MAVDSYSAPDPVPAGTVCPRCESAMPASASFCPGCGRSMTPVTSAERLAAASGYLTFVPAVVLLFLPAFRGSRFVRFHAWQSILLWMVFLLASIIGVLVSNIAAAVALLLVGILGVLAMFFLCAVLSLKAWQGERLELPLFRQLAERLG